MLDRHLAQLFSVETRVLNQAVRRNMALFPNDFMFTLTRQKIRDLSQIVISPGLKHAPNVFAFTAQGVAMLSSVLNNPRAIKVNLEIMRAFVRLGAALRKLNLRDGQPWLDEARIAKAIRGLEQAAEHRLMEVNQSATELLLYDDQKNRE